MGSYRQYLKSTRRKIEDNPDFLSEVARLYRNPKKKEIEQLLKPKSKTYKNLDSAIGSLKRHYLGIKKDGTSLEKRYLTDIDKRLDEKEERFEFGDDALRKITEETFGKTFDAPKKPENKFFASDEEYYDDSEVDSYNYYDDDDEVELLDNTFGEGKDLDYNPSQQYRIRMYNDNDLGVNIWTVEVNRIYRGVGFDAFMRDMEAMLPDWIANLDFQNDFTTMKRVSMSFDSVALPMGSQGVPYEQTDMQGFIDTIMQLFQEVKEIVDDYMSDDDLLVGADFFFSERSL
jgi:hypothetical protein